ncbi:MAG: hypothetical protein K5927_09860 [Lachnospiraceae bacterium]|nr:hypothetical protein [Lachnospiraceae bacterium]
MNSKRPTDLSAYYKLTAIFFIAVTAIFLIAGIVLKDREYSSKEKRNLKSFPAVSFESLTKGEFENGLEEYIADQFACRDILMTAKTAVKMATGKKESQGVILCEDGWLLQPLNEPDAELFDDMTSSVKDFAARYPDIKMYFMPVPTSAWYKKDLLPAGVYSADQDAYIDRIKESLKGSLQVVDVRELFNMEKLTQLYYRTDHHWTTDGAYTAYAEFTGYNGAFIPYYEPSVVANDFSGSLVSKSGFITTARDAVKIYVPQFEQHYVVTYEAEQKKSASLYEPEYLRSDDPYMVFFGGNHAKITIETAAESSRKILVFKDSYANSFIPFLLEDYELITVIDPRYYYDDLDTLIKLNGYTDVLFLYNVNTLAEDRNLQGVLKES